MNPIALSRSLAHTAGTQHITAAPCFAGDWSYQSFLIFLLSLREIQGVGKGAWLLKGEDGGVVWLSVACHQPVGPLHCHVTELLSCGLSLW